MGRPDQITGQRGVGTPGAAREVAILIWGSDWETLRTDHEQLPWQMGIMEGYIILHVSAMRRIWGWTI